MESANAALVISPPLADISMEEALPAGNVRKTRSVPELSLAGAIVVTPLENWNGAAGFAGDFALQSPPPTSTVALAKPSGLIIVRTSEVSPLLFPFCKLSNVSVTVCDSLSPSCSSSPSSLTDLPARSFVNEFARPNCAEIIIVLLRRQTVARHRNIHACIADGDLGRRYPYNRCVRCLAGPFTRVVFTIRA